jgi:RNA polymerase-binding transcription factor DksA
MAGKSDRADGAKSEKKSRSVESRPLDVAQYQTRLREMKDQLERDLETHSQSVTMLSGGPDEPGSGQHWERSGYGDHQADDATELFEREKEVGLEQTLRAHMQQVNHALARIEDGTYGTCERCGKPIAKARLDAMPEATLCIECKGEIEQQATHGQAAEYASTGREDPVRAATR